MAPQWTDTTRHLKTLFTQYFNTHFIADTVRSGDLLHFMAPDCHRIYRPEPSSGCKDRAAIIRLHDEAESIIGVRENNQDLDALRRQKNSFCVTVRPLNHPNLNITEDQATGAGFASAADVKQQINDHRWEGLRVDIWLPADDAIHYDGQLLKCQFWWKKRDGIWLQVLGDILYDGPLDGTEGKKGDFIIGGREN